MALKYRQFRLHRAHEVSCEGIIGKTGLGSVATYATTQQLADETVDSDSRQGQTLLHAADNRGTDVLRES